MYQLHNLRHRFWPGLCCIGLGWVWRPGMRSHHPSKKNSGRKKNRKNGATQIFEPHFFCVCFVPRGHCYFCFKFSSGKNFLKPRKHRIIGGSLQRVFAKLKQSVNPNIPNQLTRLMDLDQQTPSVVNDDFFCPLYPSSLFWEYLGIIYMI